MTLPEFLNHFNKYQRDQSIPNREALINAFNRIVNPGIKANAKAQLARIGGIDGLIAQQKKAKSPKPVPVTPPAPVIVPVIPEKPKPVVTPDKAKDIKPSDSSTPKPDTKIDTTIDVPSEIKKDASKEDTTKTTTESKSKAEASGALTPEDQKLEAQRIATIDKVFARVIDTTETLQTRQELKDSIAGLISDLKDINLKNKYLKHENYENLEVRRNKNLNELRFGGTQVTLENFPLYLKDFISRVDRVKKLNNDKAKVELIDEVFGIITNDAVDENIKKNLIRGKLKGAINLDLVLSLNNRIKMSEYTSNPKYQSVQSVMAQEGEIPEERN